MPVLFVAICIPSESSIVPGPVEQVAPVSASVCNRHTMKGDQNAEMPKDRGHVLELRPGAPICCSGNQSRGEIQLPSTAVHPQLHICQAQCKELRKKKERKSKPEDPVSLEEAPSRRPNRSPQCPLCLLYCPLRVTG